MGGHETVLPTVSLTDGPVGVVCDNLEYRIPSDIHPGQEILARDPQKIIADAKKKVTVKSMQSLLKSVGVSMSGKGNGILAQENRSKKKLLENAVIVAAIVAAIPVGSSHNIPVSANLAEYVKLLREHNLIEDMDTLKRKLTEMPLTKKKKRLLCAMRSS